MAKYPIEGLKAATIDNLAWLAECWFGKKEDDIIEERWSKPSADTMMGMFRWIKEGNIFFYEFMTIEKAAEGLVLRIKHFSPGLIGWEEKDKSFSCVLTQLESNKAVFFSHEKEELLWLVFEREVHSLKIFFDSGTDSPKPENIFQFECSETC